MAEDRLKAMLKMLVNENECRQKIIVEYFGETGKPCGKCDICLGAAQNTLNPEELQKIWEHLTKTLQIRAMDVKSYTNIYPFNKRKRIVKALRDFESEQLITIANSGLISLRH